ncbi:MAG: DHHA1 domain-containing protein [Thermoanaerobaculia bacterium]|nr:DHHA1 domain-containing protein [Thermoanaerobaculia bacterium]
MAGDRRPAASEASKQALARLDDWMASRAKRRRWLVLTHDNPDPDAIASAGLLRLLLRERYRAAVTVGYGGIIGRAENRAMVKSLGLRLSHVRHLSWKNYGHFALVDTQPRTGNNQLPDDVVPDLVIDHHPPRKESLASPLADIRREYGATASIVAELLLAAELDLGRIAATAYVYALRTETLDFSREGLPIERAIYDWLLPLADKRALGRIQHPKLPRGYFQTLHQALERVATVENVLVCHLDEVPTPDDVPQLADLLLRLEGKTWCLVTGAQEDRIYLAIRTTNPRADAGRAMRRILGRKGKGGGHGMIAGGWYPRDDTAPAATRELLARRLLRQLRKDPARLSPLL